MIRFKAPQGFTQTVVTFVAAGAPRIVPVVCVAIFIAGLTFVPVSADIPASQYIQVFFEQGGKRYDHPVSFRITCYGYR